MSIKTPNLLLFSLPPLFAIGTELKKVKLSSLSLFQRKWSIKVEKYSCFVVVSIKRIDRLFTIIWVSFAIY